MYMYLQGISAVGSPIKKASNVPLHVTRERNPPPGQTPPRPADGLNYPQSRWDLSSSSLTPDAVEFLLINNLIVASLSYLVLFNVFRLVVHLHPSS